ncbi:hypothetical protein ACYCUO_09345 [Paenibacillus sp. SEL2]|uniref:hypothetical protein n=1 Tax=Paenibacillus TaxID=44249 RepID=UPI0020B734BB|nr:MULTISPECIES: hypothetical protein [Paenibacillus]MCP3806157.1 hypothetical protein [Paenibacillus sp. Lou8.1]MDY8116601.1 hypothetical protein [Paenibacillus polymyxa]
MSAWIADLLAAKRFGLEQVVVQYSQHFHFTNEDLHEEDYMNKNDDRHDNTPE